MRLSPQRHRGVGHTSTAPAANRPVRGSSPTPTYPRPSAQPASIRVLSIYHHRDTASTEGYFIKSGVSSPALDNAPPPTHLTSTPSRTPARIPLPARIALVWSAAAMLPRQPCLRSGTWWSGTSNNDTVVQQHIRIITTVAQRDIERLSSHRCTGHS